jgi:hypothetical protein
MAILLYHVCMKKIVIFAIFLFLVSVAFAQNYTFQDLPWGATKEQVIAKLGEPNSKTNNDIYFNYVVSLSGYKTLLKISFWGNKGLDNVTYTINAWKELNPSQVEIAFLLLFGQLVEKYGPYTEKITDNDGSPHSWVWHFNNFHISIYAVLFNQFSVVYSSTTAWNRGEELLNGWVRLPNRGL